MPPRCSTALLKPMKRPQVRIEAMGALGEMDPEHAVSFLAPFVSAPDVNIARAAIQALSTVGPPHAMPALLKALRNPDPHLKKTAIAAVGRCMTREAAEMLQWLAASEKSPEMAQAAMDALSDLGTSDAGIGTGSSHGRPGKPGLCRQSPFPAFPQCHFAFGPAPVPPQVAGETGGNRCT